jgi:geranylgeranyl diphosphate synthase type I
LLKDSPAAQSCLLDATQRLISGQSDDLRLERADDVRIGDVLRMEAGKTAALLSCAAAIGPAAVGAPQPMTDALGRYGFELGLAFQLVDDVLGVVGDPARTGKSASSDLRAGKRSAPIVAALGAEGAAAARLRELLVGGPPDTDDDVALAAKLVEEAGGIDWARTEAAARIDQATAALDGVGLLPAVTADLAALGRYVLERDH